MVRFLVMNRIAAPTISTPPTTVKMVVPMPPVEGSLLPQVGVVTATEVSYPLTASERVRAEISLPEQAAAPLKEGSIAGKITFFLGEEVIGESYLLYDRSVPENAPKETLLQRMTAFLRKGDSHAFLRTFFRG